MSRTGDFATDVLDCMDEISALLPLLTARFKAMIVVCAFAEHLGSALQLLVRRNVCDAQQARRLLQHIERIALESAAR